MKIALDTETHLIRPGCVAPRLVCLSWATEKSLGLLDRADGLRFAWKVYQSDQIIVGANIFYDLGVLCAEDKRFITPTFELFEAGRFRDVQVAAKMRDIRDGMLKYSYDDDGNATKTRHSLADLVFRFLKKDRFHEKKNAPTARDFLALYPECHFQTGGLAYADWPEAAQVEPWRLRYSMLDGLPIADWPAPAADYALEDAQDTLAVDAVLGDPIADELNQLQYQWALHLMSLWGVRTDPEAVRRIKEVLEAEAEEGRRALIRAGLMRTNGTKNMEAIYDKVVQAYTFRGITVPATPSGRPSTSEESLRESGDPDLMVLAEVASTFKLLAKDIPEVEKSIHVPVNVRWNGLVESGRTSASPNKQNQPRKGGIRECHVPRPGWVYCFVDFDTAELRALAQACLDLLGHSELARVLNAGQDPHAALAADILGITYEDMTARLASGDPQAKETRQYAKIPNFGLPGGMGSKSLVAWAKSSGIIITLDFAEQLVRAWHRKFPEMSEYFNWISTAIGPIGEGSITQLYSARVRGGVSFCAACNTLFQGLVADAAKAALYEVQRACYTRPSSPLWGSRPVLFIHDEIGTEIPYDPRRPELASAAADEKTRLMVNAAQLWMPDVKVTAKPVMVRRWFKGAEPVRTESGLLVPCRPEVDAKGKTRWVSDVEPLAMAA